MQIFNIKLATVDTSKFSWAISNYWLLFPALACMQNSWSWFYCNQCTLCYACLHTIPKIITRCSVWSHLYITEFSSPWTSTGTSDTVWKNSPFTCFIWKNVLQKQHDIIQCNILQVRTIKIYKHVRKHERKCQCSLLKYINTEICTIVMLCCWHNTYNVVTVCYLDCNECHFSDIGKQISWINFYTLKWRNEKKTK